MIRSAEALGWRARTTDPDSTSNLAAFLGDLACGEDASPAVAERLARRATAPEFPGGEPDHLLTQLLAARLTSEDPACPAAAELPEDLRADLEELAARLDQPAPE